MTPTQPPACGKISDDQLRNTLNWAVAKVGNLSGAEVIVVACAEALAARNVSRAHPAPVADERAEVGHTWDDLIALGDKFKLPVDVKIMAGTFTKGVKVGTMLRCVKHHAGYASEIPDSEYPTLGVWSPDIAALSAQPPGALEREKKCPHGYTGWCPECVDATPERAPGGDALNGMYGKHAVDGISALLKDAEPLHRDAFEHLEPVPHIATLINNNQFGWTNIIETAPNVTIDVGTKLYDQKALFAVGVAMLERGRKGGFEDGYIAGKAYQKHFASAPPPSSSPSATADATLRAALEKLRTNIDAGLLTALRNGGQLDMDGCEVRVSRQACEEAADHLEQLAALAGNEGGK